MTFTEASPVAVRDFMTETGAKELKRRLEHNWTGKHNSGAVVFRVELESSPRCRTHEIGSLYVVRSNLVRGLPP